MKEISKVINPSGTEQEINEADAERRLKLVYCNGRPNQSVHHKHIGTGRYWLGTSRGAAGCVRSSRHGRVEFTSDPGQGTTFTVRLPISTKRAEFAFTSPSQRRIK